MSEHNIVVEGDVLDVARVVAAGTRGRLAPPYLVTVVAFRPGRVGDRPDAHPEQVLDVLRGLALAGVIDRVADVVRADYRLTATIPPNPPRTHLVVRSLAPHYS